VTPPERREHATPRPRDYIARLTPYEWEAMAGEVADAAGIPESAVVRFDTNTTPWPPVAWEKTVLDAPRLPANEYPHPSNEPLRSALARRLSVEAEQVVVTSGADEALFLLASAYLGPERRGVVADPSFSMFRVVTESVGAELIKVPLDANWDLPRDGLLDAVSDQAVGVVWLCSPNNPTGRLIECGLAEEVLEAAPHAVVVVDGARVGYLVGQTPVTRTIETVRLPQNMTAFGIAAAGRALEEQAGLTERVAAIVAERRRLETELRARGWELLPSAANFVLGRPPQPAAQTAAWLQGAGLIVRSYPAHPRLKDWLRIAVRAPDEDDRLLSRLDLRGPAEEPASRATG
jgi:histidinol-phosphate aminotransferase